MGHFTVRYLAIAPAAMIPGGRAGAGAVTRDGRTDAGVTLGIGVIPGTRIISVFRHQDPD